MVVKQIELEVAERTGKPNALRAKGLIPAIVYGKGMESIPVEVIESSFRKILAGHAGSNAILNLKLGSKSNLPVITHDIQRDPISDKLLHIDFYRIKMDEVIKTHVPIVVTGIATGVKDDGGILVTMMTEIEVKCLPGSIPEKIEVDVTALKINDTIHVSDLKAITGIEFVTMPKEMIVTVAPPAKEETPEETAAATTEAAAVPSALQAPAQAGVAAAPAPDAKAPAGQPAAKGKAPEAKK